MKKSNWFIDRGIFCSKCQHYKFKTNIKGKEYECRKCGEVRLPAMQNASM